MDWLLNTPVNQLDGFIIHMIVACVLGGVIGLERQWTRHQTGILTNLIVCLGSYAFSAFGYLVDEPNVDLTRIGAQVVCGIGFLGAGVILREGGNIRGLNTAATVWTSAAVGILCCVPNLCYAIVVGVAVVFMHLILHPVSDKIDKIKRYEQSEKKEKQEALYKISVVCPEEFELEIRKNIISLIKNESEALLHTLESTTSNTEDGNRKIKAYISTKTPNEPLIENIITKVGKNEDVISAGWKIVRD